MEPIDKLTEQERRIVRAEARLETLAFVVRDIATSQLPEGSSIRLLLVNAANQAESSP